MPGQIEPLSGFDRQVFINFYLQLDPTSRQCEDLLSRQFRSIVYCCTNCFLIEGGIRRNYFLVCHSVCKIIQDD